MLLNICRKKLWPNGWVVYYNHASCGAQLIKFTIFISSLNYAAEMVEACTTRWLKPRREQMYEGLKKGNLQRPKDKLLTGRSR